MEERKLNVDIAKAISELEAMLKEFRLKIPIYKLFFKGKGLEFDGYRDFYPDDDAERIDWKVSSRAQKLLVKQYVEERDLRVMFLVDVGNNMVFGSTEKIKCEYVTELVAAFSKVMLNVNDRIGFIFFSDAITHFVDCKSGEKQFNIFIETLSDGNNYGGKTDLDLALDFAVDYLDDSISSVIIISDFLDITSETEKKLGLLSHRFETVAIRIRDPLDVTLPDVEGEVVIEDPKTRQQIIVNPRVAKKSYEAYAAMQGNMVKDMFEKSELDHLDLMTSESFAEPLAIFLKERIEGK